MKLFLLPLILLAIYFANSSQFPSKLPESACKIVDEVLKKENWMKTIVILKFTNKLDSEDNIAKCLTENITVVLIDMTRFDSDTIASLQNPTFVVMIIDVAQEFVSSDWFSLILDSLKTPLIRHYSKVLILTTDRKAKFFAAVKEVFTNDGVWNYAIIYEAYSSVFVEFFNNQEGHLVLNQIEGDLIDKIYPNHQKDLKGLIHRFFAYQQHPMVTINKGLVKSKLSHFWRLLEKFENSDVRFGYVEKDNEVSADTLNRFMVNLLSKRQVQMILNTMIKFTGATPKLMVYEETGFCALVPLPENDSSNLMFLEPFDLATWLLLGFTVVVCTFVWHFTGQNVSIGYISFFFWAFSFGQSVDFAANRKVFVVVLQILVFMLFILGNAYQGLITSFMISQNEPSKLNSFDELLSSDYKIIVSQYFHSLMKNEEKYRKANSLGKIIKSTSTLAFQDFAKLDQAIVMDCEVAQYVISKGFAPNLYIINDKVMPYYEQLQASFLNKFLKRWQLVMDWCFEAGLPQAWKKMENEEKIFKESDDGLDEILKLDDIAVAFYALLVGSAIGLVVLLCEILFHDCLQPFMKRRRYKIQEKKSQMEELSVREVQRRKFKFLKRKLNVRRIQVRPINETEM